MRRWWVLGGVIVAGDASAEPACTAPSQVGALQDASLQEVSGLAVAGDGSMWAIEDSGNRGALSGIDAAGRRVARVDLTGVTNTDWEDVVAGPCGATDARECLYVADVGDNDAKRADVGIYRVPVPATGAQAATPEVLRFRYADHPRDAEALVVTPAGRILVFSKRDNGVAHFFEVPAVFGGGEIQVAREVGALPVLASGGVGGRGSWVTSAALRGDGGLLLRTYTAIWGYAAKGEGWDPASATALPAAVEAQGEAIAWDDAKRGYWQVSEGTHAPISFTACGT